MKRWLSGAFIAVYLSSLLWGIAAHAMKFGVNSHPIMYYLVWDMFCGWSPYETRYHVVGEGDSGKFYELGPGPWPHFSPFGDLPRHHYDAYGSCLRRMAMNTLKHSEHPEPIRRVLVFEEAWHKKYNLPDNLWALRFDEPKEPYSYFWLYASYTGEGDILMQNTGFLNYSTALSITDNPRLLSDARRGRPFFAFNPSMRDGTPVYDDPTAWAGAGETFAH